VRRECTNERTAAWSSSEPQDDRIPIVCSFDGLYEDIVKGSVRALHIEIA
jgi:hypothetical protein